MKRNLILFSILILFGILGAARSAVGFQIPNTHVRVGTLDSAIEPPVLTEGSAVTIRGAIGVSAQAPAVRIDVTPPSGSTGSFSVRPNEKGEFSIAFRQTQKSGTYNVLAQNADGRGI